MVLDLELSKRLENERNVLIQRDQVQRIQREKVSLNKYLFDLKKNICVSRVQKTCLFEDLKPLEVS